jgi:hypothetical protein
MLGKLQCESVETVTGTDAGTQAIDKIRSEEFDVVVTDRKMPDIGGFTVAEAVRQVDDVLGRRPTPGTKRCHLWRRVVEHYYYRLSSNCYILSHTTPSSHGHRRRWRIGPRRKEVLGSLDTTPRQRFGKWHV